MKANEKVKDIISELDSLSHYGVLGMKWGRRKSNSRSASSGAKRKSSSKKVKAISKIKKMSDTELRQKINRLQMEKQYSQLTQREKSSGEKFVQDVLTGAAKQTASSYVSKYMTKGIDELVKKAKK